jgi:hypothetical protein
VCFSTLPTAQLKTIDSRVDQQQQQLRQPFFTHTHNKGAVRSLQGRPNATSSAANVRHYHPLLTRNQKSAGAREANSSTASALRSPQLNALSTSNSQSSRVSQGKNTHTRIREKFQCESTNKNSYNEINHERKKNESDNLVTGRKK